MRVRMMSAVIAVAGLFPLSAWADACVKPPMPACLDDSSTWVAAERLQDCQGAVKRYIDQTMDYTKCLNDEVVRTGDEMTKAVNRFNCRLSARQDCR